MAERESIGCVGVYHDCEYIKIVTDYLRSKCYKVNFYAFKQHMDERDNAMEHLFSWARNQQLILWFFTGKLTPRALAKIQKQNVRNVVVEMDGEHAIKEFRLGNFERLELYEYAELVLTTSPQHAAALKEFTYLKARVQCVDGMSLHAKAFQGQMAQAVQRPLLIVPETMTETQITCIANAQVECGGVLNVVSTNDVCKPWTLPMQVNYLGTLRYSHLRHLIECSNRLILASSALCESFSLNELLWHISDVDCLEPVEWFSCRRMHRRVLSDAVMLTEVLDDFIVEMFVDMCFVATQTVIGYGSDTRVIRTCLEQEFILYREFGSIICVERYCKENQVDRATFSSPAKCLAHWFYKGHAEGDVLYLEESCDSTVKASRCLQHDGHHLSTTALKLLKTHFSLEHLPTIVAFCERARLPLFEHIQFLVDTQFVLDFQSVNLDASPLPAPVIVSSTYCNALCCQPSCPSPAPKPKPKPPPQPKPQPKPPSPKHSPHHCSPPHHSPHHRSPKHCSSPSNPRRKVEENSKRDRDRSAKKRSAKNKKAKQEEQQQKARVREKHSSKRHGWFQKRDKRSPENKTKENKAKESKRSKPKSKRSKPSKVKNSGSRPREGSEGDRRFFAKVERQVRNRSETTQALVKDALRRLQECEQVSAMSRRLEPVLKSARLVLRLLERPDLASGFANYLNKAMKSVAVRPLKLVRRCLHQ